MTDRRDISKLNLRTIDKHPLFFEQAKKAWEEDENVEGIMCFMPNTLRLGFLADNIWEFKKFGVYEKALYEAYLTTRTNNHHYSQDMLTAFFNWADREKLRLLGSLIPEGESFTLYRGVSGKGRARRVCSFSWTESPNIAAWFAKRFSDLGDPAVFKVTVPREQILFCCDERNEKEYVLALPLPAKPRRVLPMPEPKIERTTMEQYLKAKKGEK